MAMEEYKLYTFRLWDQHRLMRCLVLDLENFQASNITEYVIVYWDIQARKYWYKDLIVKTPPPFGNNDKWPQFENTMQNCMSTKVSVYQITPLVYLIQEEDFILYNRTLNHMARQYYIIYGIPLSGKTYKPNNYTFWMNMYKLTIGGTYWAYKDYYRAPGTDMMPGSTHRRKTTNDPKKKSMTIERYMQCHITGRRSSSLMSPTW